MSLQSLPSAVPDSLRTAGVENVSPHNLHEYFYVDKETVSSSLSGSALKCRKPMSKLEHLLMFPHVLVAGSREEAKEAIRANPDLLPEAEEALKASLDAGMDEPWAEHEALMVRTLADVSDVPREVALAALVQAGYDIVSALMLAEEYSGSGTDSSAGWGGEREVPSDFKMALMHANPPLSRLSPTLWQVVYECHQRSPSLSGVEGSSGPVLCGRYTWSDSEEEEVVTVVVQGHAGLRKEDVVSTLTSTHWTLKMRGEEECLLSGLLGGVVMPDESFWTIDESSVVMTLQKREGSGRWEQLIRGELHVQEETVGSFWCEVVLHFMVSHCTCVVCAQLAKAKALLAREEESRLEAVLAAMEECGSALSQLGSGGLWG